MPRQTFLHFHPNLYSFGSSCPFVLIQYRQEGLRQVKLTYGILPAEPDLHLHDRYVFTIKSATELVTAEKTEGQVHAPAQIAAGKFEADLDVMSFKYPYDLSNIPEVHTLIVGQNLYDWHRSLEVNGTRYKFDDLARPLHFEALELLGPNFLTRAINSLHVYS